MAKINLQRVNINLPTDLVNRVKEYANKNGINTTAAYIILLNQALDYKIVVDNIPYMLEVIKNETIEKSMEKDN